MHLRVGRLDIPPYVRFLSILVYIHSMIGSSLEPINDNTGEMRLTDSTDVYDSMHGECN